VDSGAFNVDFLVEMGTFYNSSYFFFGLVALVLIGTFLGWRSARRATVVLVLWFLPFFVLLGLYHALSGHPLLPDDGELVVAGGPAPGGL